MRTEAEEQNKNNNNNNKNLTEHLTFGWFSETALQAAGVLNGFTLKLKCFIQHQTNKTKPKL